MAVECGYLDLIKLLLDAGADINAPAARSRGATALQLAAIKGYLGVSKMLVDLGADLNAPRATNDGRTALEGAAEHGRIDTIQYLLSQGVETTGKGRLSYLRAIRYAEMEMHLVASTLLKTWREWTAVDDAWWKELQSLRKDEFEWSTEEDFQDQSDSELELEKYSSGKTYGYDGMQDLVLEDAPAAELLTHEISVAADPAWGIISELDDLETMANDIFEFWNGPRFDIDTN
ncbi:Protein fem-1-like protein [Colletotrichum sp. SAR 10_65]|nr:Protein fem-1-like protein [Colletotrichum sp. SAR 10_65]